MQNKDPLSEASRPLPGNFFLLLVTKLPLSSYEIGNVVLLHFVFHSCITPLKQRMITGINTILVRQSKKQ